MKDNKRIIFLTGATGLVGSYLLKILLQEGYKVYALARSKDNKNARDRVRDVLKFWDKDILDRKSHNLIVLEGDITEKNLGLGKQSIDLLKNEIEEVFHCAAATRFNAPLKVLRKVNLEGTRNILELCCEWRREGIFNKINYLSTAFICGDYKGIFKEDDFNLNQNFNNNYEQSKSEAEALVRKYIENGMQALIFRPSIVVGDYVSGKTIDFKMFYEPLHLLSLEIFSEVPLNTKTFLNLIPVDLAAKAIYTLSVKKNTNKVYHITSPKDFPIDYIVDKASSFFHFEKPKYVGLDRYKVISKSPAAKKILEIFIPYFNFRALFSSYKTQTILKKYSFEYPSIDDEFLYRIFKFCSDKRFIKTKSKRDTIKNES